MTCSKLDVEQYCRDSNSIPGAKPGNFLVLLMSAMFTSLAIKQDQTEEFDAIKQKMAFFMAFNWPFSNYGLCGL